MIKKASEINESTSWQEMTIGGEIYEGGTSVLVNTGDWRTMIPVFHEEKCKQCMLCVPYCPDSSIPVKDGKRLDFDFMHCKGCGVCYKVCPFQAISLEKEGA
ncbi:MAG TPA: 4Fe-4S binding protein [Bacillota bacterium]|nr:4Fe-4S binding protein [Bacillota bacterium]